MSETVKPTRLQRQKPQGLSINVPGNRSPAHRQQGKKRSLFQRSSLSTETEQAPLSAANRPMFSRQTSLRKSIKRGTADWFGVGDNEAGQQERWQQRSRRHCNMRLGPLKPQYMKELEQAHQRWQRIRQNWVQGEAADDECALTSPTSPNDVPSSFSHQRRQSVARMSYDAATSLARKYSFKESGFKRTPSSRRTFVRATPAQKHPPDLEDRLDVSFFTKDDSSGQAQKKDKPGQNLQAYRPIAQDKSSKQQDMTYVQAGIPRTGKAKSAHLGIKGKSRGCRIPEIMQRIAFRQEKRAYGLGMVGRLLHRAYRPQLDNKTWKQLQEVDQHRPYFTYWLTVVHILITLFSVCTYGIAPIGFAQHEEIENILNHKGQHVIATYIQQQNFWIGPSSETLIHLGAKFAPCMRQDTQVAEGIADSRNYEAGSGCCVRNDGSGCVQMQRKACSEVLSTWYRWPEHDPPLFINGKNRTSGPVCGQDPRTCEEPASAVPHEWPDNITQWPICTKPVQANHTGFPQMDCTVTGHPCCIGTKGQCEITSREYCDFMDGYFHNEASLCSQVHCMWDVCGLLPFLNQDVPDQFYRLWLSLFLHAGLLHCLVSVCFQMTVLRDLEKLAGWLRISIIFILSGIAGNLASATFLPYRAEVGPAGSHLGIMACLFVELFQSWQILQLPWYALTKLLFILIVLFAFGLLPWVDNFAQIFGFASGLLLSFAMLPYVAFGRFDRYKKRFQIIVTLLIFGALLAGLIILFYIRPMRCNWCEYLTCLPFTHNFCEKYDLDPNLKDIDLARPT
uniref:inactive rhomboid protein 1-like isoform X1 n=2 Tax=Myxine glutinosa TaxID=7769 RepID=UPI00358F5F44